MKTKNGVTRAAVLRDVKLAQYPVRTTEMRFRGRSEVREQCYEYCQDQKKEKPSCCSPESRLQYATVMPHQPKRVNTPCFLLLEVSAWKRSEAFCRKFLV